MAFSIERAAAKRGTRLAAARGAATAVPAKIPLADHNPKMVRLDTETKLITHAIRMAAFNTEALHASGDIITGDGALTALCQQLTDRSPGDGTSWTQVTIPSP